MFVDLVCKMVVDEKTTKFRYSYKGKTYYFCSSNCQSTFEKNPEQFVK